MGSPGLTGRRIIALAVCTLTIGCSRPSEPRSQLAAETGVPDVLAEGKTFHFVEHFAGGPPPTPRERRADGPYRLALGEAYQPILHAPAPYVMRQTLALPARAMMRLAFGLTDEGDGARGDGVRFIVRVRCEGEDRELLSQVVSRWRGPDAPNWRIVTLDLSFAAGREVELELATEILADDRGGPSQNRRSAYAVWVNPTVLARSQNERPNIVLLLIDALRADHLGCYGYDRPTSPFLDRLGREGVLFEQAHAQATYTFASVPSLLTSTYPFATGGKVAGLGSLGVGDGGKDAVIASVNLTSSLQQHLRDNGYTTLASVGGGYLSPALGSDSGFDWYWSPTGSPMLVEQLPPLRERLRSDPQVPFFLFLHTYEVHDYFQAQGDGLAEYDRGYTGKLRRPGGASEAVLSCTTDGLSEEDLQYIVDLYDGEVRHTDQHLGIFLQWLLAEPWGTNTIVIVTADHGEMLGEKGWMHHGFVPYRPLAHVPLMMWFPDGRWGGVRVAEPVSLVDVMPTVLDLVGLQATQSTVGRSLTGLVEGEGDGEMRPVFSEGRFGCVLLREGPWWYLSWADQQQEALYDMATDPAQRRDLSESHPETVRQMRHRLGEVAMEAARGARLVVWGERSERVTLILECEMGFSYLYCPTLAGPWSHRGLKTGHLIDSAGASRGPRRVEVDLDPGDDVHVILFESGSPDDAVLVSAVTRGETVEPGRFHLGEHAVLAEGLPVAVNAEAARFVAAQPPLPEEMASWGISIWLPPDSPWRRAAPSRAGKMSADLERQLRSLGYLR